MTTDQRTMATHDIKHIKQEPGYVSMTIDPVTPLVTTVPNDVTLICIKQEPGEQPTDHADCGDRVAEVASTIDTIELGIFSGILL